MKKNTQHNYTGPFLAMVFLFLIVGFLTTANTQFQGPLREAFLSDAGSLKNTFATLITFSWFLAYPLSGPLGSRWVNSHGYKGTLLRGLMVMAAGLALFFLSSWITVRFPEAVIGSGAVRLHTGFLIFLLWNRIRHDTGPAPDKHLSVFPVSNADRDAGIHVSGKIDISDGSSINPSLVTFQLTDELTGANLRRAGKSSRRQHCFDGIQRIIFFPDLTSDS